MLILCPFDTASDLPRIIDSEPDSSQLVNEQTSNKTNKYRALNKYQQPSTIRPSTIIDN